MDIWQLILNALPEAIGGLIAVLVVALAGYLFRRFTRQRVPALTEAKAEVPTATVELAKPPTPEIPHNLPQPGEFIGREREKGQVREALASRSFLVSIDGIGGIGKTALALEVAHECLRASEGGVPTDGIPIFDAFIWTTAKDRELTLGDVLDAIARTLDYPYIAQLPPKEKPSEAAKLLRQYKCLLIVDNFETITDDAVRDFLLDLPEPSKALITSREQKLRQARAISLRGMEQGEALALIRNEGKRLGLGAVEQAEERVLLRLYEATGGAPLAIKWAVGQMKQRGQSLDTVLDYLYGARGDIFENIFARSWGLLSENARRVLMVMPIFAASASKPAIEAASDVHKWDLDEALGQLV
ncbi:MAG: NB-ARC domain-containing protein, partial [Anaerolineae bacterium]